MANPTTLDGFSFAVFYEYLDWQTGEWVQTQFTLGEGQDGYDQAQSFYDAVVTQINAGMNVVRNPAVRYSSIVTWTDWEQASA